MTQDQREHLGVITVNTTMFCLIAILTGEVQTIADMICFYFMGAFIMMALTYGELIGTAAYDEWKSGKDKDETQ